MTTKHTPGPWYIDETSDGRRGVYAQMTGALLAETWSHGDPPISDEEDARNARLIAEAPAMRKALEDCLCALVGADAGRHPAFAEARSILARIEGEEEPTYTVEYRPEVRKWEVKRGTGHVRMFDYEEQARKFISNQ